MLHHLGTRSSLDAYGSSVAQYAVADPGAGGIMSVQWSMRTGEWRVDTSLMKSTPVAVFVSVVTLHVLIALGEVTPDSTAMSN